MNSVPSKNLRRGKAGYGDKNLRRGKAGYGDKNLRRGKAGYGDKNLRRGKAGYEATTCAWWDLSFVAVYMYSCQLAITVATQVPFHFCPVPPPTDYTQSVYGSILALEDVDYGAWPPAFIVDMYAWWCENVDQLLGHNPMW